MSLNKRIKGDYDITTLGVSDSISLTAQGGINVNGDLTVTGTQTTVNSTDTNIQDNVIVLNSGEVGPGITHPSGTAGILIERGIVDVDLRFAESMQLNAQPGWEATDDGVTWYPLNSAASTFNLVDDLTPQLGGDLDVNGYSITSVANGNIVFAPNGTGEVVFEQNLTIKNQVGDETPLAGYNRVFAKVPEAGGSGLFVANTDVTEELVSKSKAIIFSIIF